MATMDGKTPTSQDPIKRQQVQQHVDNVLDTGMKFDASQALYSQWAQDGTYEEMLKANQTVYAGPFEMKTMMKSLFPQPQNAVVLDLGAGTGMVGEELRNLGFTTVDAVEPCKEFVDVLGQKDLYRRVVPECVGGVGSLTADDDQYDAVVTVGTFCAGHVPCDALYEFLRILKPGGFFVNCMRESFMSTVPEYQNRLEALINQLVEEKRWEKVAWKKYEHHFMEEPGIIMAFRVC